MKIKKIYNHYEIRKMVKGKTYFLSFEYRPTKKDIKNKLMDILKNQNEIISDKQNFNYYITEYIKNKTNVLSPSTIRTYKSTLKNLPLELSVMPLNEIDTKTLQKYINQLSSKNSYKTIKNIIGLLLATLSYNGIDKKYKLKYPQKIKKILYIPTDQDIKKITEYFTNTKYYIFFRLCLYGLRVSEIIALTINDLMPDGTLYINKAKVKNEHNTYELKTTKTIQSNRVIKIDKELAKKIINQKYILDITYTQFYKQFIKALKILNIKYFSPHKLRHYIASKMHTMNIPTKYIMEYGGWSNYQTLENIYTHTNETDKDIFYNKVNTELENIIK